MYQSLKSLKSLHGTKSHVRGIETIILNHFKLTSTLKYLNIDTYLLNIGSLFKNRERFV